MMTLAQQWREIIEYFRGLSDSRQTASPIRRATRQHMSRMAQHSD